MLTRWISLLIEEYSVSTCSRRKQHLSFLAAWIWKTSYQTAFTIIRGRASQRPVSTEANLKVISTFVSVGDKVQSNWRARITSPFSRSASCISSVRGSRCSSATANCCVLTLLRVRPWRTLTTCSDGRHWSFLQCPRSAESPAANPNYWTIIKLGNNDIKIALPRRSSPHER